MRERHLWQSSVGVTCPSFKAAETWKRNPPFQAARWQSPLRAVKGVKPGPRGRVGKEPAGRAPPGPAAPDPPPPRGGGTRGDHRGGTARPGHPASPPRRRHPAPWGLGATHLAEGGAQHSGPLAAAAAATRPPPPPFSRRGGWAPPSCRNTERHHWQGRQEGGRPLAAGAAGAREEGRQAGGPAGRRRASGTESKRRGGSAASQPDPAGRRLRGPARLGSPGHAVAGGGERWGAARGGAGGRAAAGPRPPRLSAGAVRHALLGHRPVRPQRRAALHQGHGVPHHTLPERGHH